MKVADVEAIFVTVIFVGADDAGAEVVAGWRGDGFGRYTGTGRRRRGVGTSECKKGGEKKGGEKKGEESGELGAHFGRARWERCDLGQIVCEEKRERLR